MKREKKSVHHIFYWNLDHEKLIKFSDKFKIGFCNQNIIELTINAEIMQ